MRVDAVVVGMGPGGEVAATRLLQAGKSVAVVERELIGGECAYWACIPSKVLLRPPEAQSEAARAAGVSEPALSWDETAAYRDDMIRHLDDSGPVSGYEKQGATVFKGAGRLAGRGVVEVGDDRIEADDIILATGSDPVIPPIEGIDQIDVWTNREATGLKTIPRSAVVVGGGPVGLELGQFLGRFGAKVTLVQSSERLLNRETAEVSELLAGYATEAGIELRAGARAVRARRDGNECIVELEGGEELRGEVVIAATGRRARVADLGLESIGVAPGERGIEVDEHCRAGAGLWAIGDVTGVSQFTHVAKYQARVACDNILGKTRVADYRAIPRVVFCDPEVAAVGLTAEQARAEDIQVATATVDLAASIARPVTFEKAPRGHLGLVADRNSKTLIGAWAVAPLASEWIHEAVLAVRARVPIDVLLDTVAQFPSYAEGYLLALEQLDL